MAESQMVCERKNSPGNGIGRDQSGNRIGMACTESSRSPAKIGNKKAGLETNWHNLGTGQTGLGNIGLGLSHVTPHREKKGSAPKAFALALAMAGVGVVMEAACQGAGNPPDPPSPSRPRRCWVV